MFIARRTSNIKNKPGTVKKERLQTLFRRAYGMLYTGEQAASKGDLHTIYHARRGARSNKDGGVSDQY